MRGCVACCCGARVDTGIAIRASLASCSGAAARGVVLRQRVELRVRAGDRDADVARVAGDRVGTRRVEIDDDPHDVLAILGVADVPDRAAGDVIVHLRREANVAPLRSSTMRDGASSAKSSTSTEPAMPMTTSAFPDAGTILTDVTAVVARSRVHAARRRGDQYGRERGQGHDTHHGFLIFVESPSVRTSWR